MSCCTSYPVHPLCPECIWHSWSNHRLPDCTSYGWSTNWVPGCSSFGWCTHRCLGYIHTACASTGLYCLYIPTLVKSQTNSVLIYSGWWRGSITLFPYPPPPVLKSKTQINSPTIAKTEYYTCIRQMFVMSTLITLLQVWGKKLYLTIWCQNMSGKIGAKM